MSWKPLLEAHFSGNEVAPGKVRSRDIAEVMTAMEEIIAVMVLSRHSNVEIKKESIVLGIKEIKEGSLSLCFDTNDYDLSSAAAKDLRRAFESDAVITLPLEARKNLEKIVNFNKRYDTSLNTSLLNGKSIPLFELTSETEIPYAPLIRGETTLYGEITRVGGTDKPRIQFRTISGQTIYCDSDRQIAVKAGQLLYKEAALRGVSAWNPEDNRIESFTVLEILDYQPGDIDATFQKLSEEFGDAFSHISNVDEFVASLRHD